MRRTSSQVLALTTRSPPLLTRSRDGRRRDKGKSTRSKSKNRKKLLIKEKDTYVKKPEDAHVKENPNESKSVNETRSQHSRKKGKDSRVRKLKEAARKLKVDMMLVMKSYGGAFTREIVSRVREDRCGIVID